MNQCSRCLKKTDGIHTCTPTKEWIALESELTTTKQKLEPLQKQVAMLRDALSNVDCFCGSEHLRACYMPMVENALSNTQATAEAFMREHDVEVITKFKRELSCIQEDSSCLCTACWQHVERLAGKAINEICAANKE